MNEEFRAITNSESNRASSVMMSSVIPSVKYSCSGSPLMFVNASTAIEGLSGSERSIPRAKAGAFVDGSGWACPMLLVTKLKVRTGSLMFLIRCSPRSSNLPPTLPFTATQTDSDRTMPPGSASPCNRAAMFTPSPYTAPSSFSITSPKCTQCESACGALPVERQPAQPDAAAPSWPLRLRPRRH